MAAHTPQLLADVPVQDDREMWPGLAALADQLASLLPGLPTSAPILISGDWGSGKTSLLRAVQRRLDKDRPQTVWFDAWQYEGGGALLRALLRAVWEAAPKEVRADAAAASLFHRLGRYALGVGLRMAPELIAAAMAGALTGDPISGAAASGAMTMVGGAVSRAASYPVELPGKPVDREPDEDPITSLWKGFAELVAKAWPDTAPVIFIDDLDRCNPEGAVRLLDDVRMLISGSEKLGCRFVVAMDRGVLVSAIGSKFTGIKDYDGNRYLEKLFPIAFAMPAPLSKDVARLVAAFLQPAGGVSFNADQMDALNQALGEPTFANPRLMKRCINRFRLVALFEAAEDRITREATEAALRDRNIAKWIVATERWPSLRTLLPAHGEEFWREVERAAASPDGLYPMPEVRRLIEDQGALPWLRREVFAGGSVRLAQLREAEGRLRRWGL